MSSLVNAAVTRSSVYTLAARASLGRVSPVARAATFSTDTSGGGDDRLDSDGNPWLWHKLPHPTINMLIENMNIPNRRVQTTLKDTVEVKSQGLHTGQPCSVQFKPVPPNTGRLFRRRDIHRRSFAPADYRKSIRFPMRQSLRMRTPHGQSTPTTIFTVEHALAALAGLGIDNVVVDVRGPEVPILDGSLEEFIDAMKSVGTARQKGHQQPLVLVRERVEATVGDSHAVLEPFNEGIDISVAIDFAHPMIGQQDYQFQLVTGEDYKNFLSQVAPARTFGFARDAARLHSIGCALGATPYNTLIFTEDGIHERCDELKFDNEPARHKAADVLGDLQLTGRWGNIRAKYTGTRPSHAVNTMLLRNLFADRKNFDIIPSQSLLKLEKVRYLPERY